ncbi:4Fe-4S binding protein [Phototrophicus methaneseepsis]|uniref:4Fe-4S binding protein n=1 Tax=Phototrophicus methaneseepsis TaxID=2710758 RepID=A0A7S8EB37_9CHLR|nr:4Fe-4S binding protein [Phototrophicus methaneseepsis]QPC83707.1 4Fe-4S binding protein [Phototrophicus methaneseepsis]
MTHPANWLPYINQNLCIGCGDCVTQCPSGALGWVESKAALIRPDICVYCATCEDICPTNAIELPFLIVRGSLKNEQEPQS